MPLPTLERTRALKRRSLVRPLAIVLAVLVLPVVAFIAWDRTEGWRLSRAAGRIEVSDEVLRGYLQPQTAEQRRASHLYGEAERLSTGSFRRSFLEANHLIEELQALPRERAARDPRLEKLRQLEEPYGRALDLLDQANALDARGFTDEDRPGPLMNRGIASVNALRISRLALSGDGERASAALLATLRLRRVYPPSSSPFRTTHGLELILTRTSVSERTLASLQQEYVRVESQESVAAQIEARRTQLMQMMAPETFGEPPWAGDGDRRVNPLGLIAYRVSRPFRTHSLLWEMAAFDRAFAAAAKPWPEKLDAMSSLIKQEPPSSQTQRRRSMFSVLLSPLPPGAALRAAAIAAATTAEAVARDRVGIAALAIARYRQANKGAAPSSLRNLVPAYVDAPLLDPFTGRGLSYTHGASGYKVYSAGVNRKDDGGEWYATTDLNPFRRGDPKDIGIYVLRLTK